MKLHADTTATHSPQRPAVPRTGFMTLLFVRIDCGMLRNWLFIRNRFGDEGEVRWKSTASRIFF
jgi:hypothetical protein